MKVLNSGQALLSVKNVSMRFGGICAVSDLSFELNAGELAGLIGPNGAGKTTVFNMITGVYTPSSGDIFFGNDKISGLSSADISLAGVTRTFQNIRLFKNLSVLENVLLAQTAQASYSVLDVLFQTKAFKAEELRLKNRALELLSLFGLESKAYDSAGSLPYGEQRELEIVRALATRPKLICLDEPAAGMNHQETESLMNTIAKIRKQFHLTVLLIEHDMKLVMGICERILVLDHGALIEEGSPIKVQNSKKVIEAYLGTEVLS